MCGIIRHRGPDEEGLYVQGPVGLGMRRLSIIDVTGGSQPAFSEDRSRVLVFNGEIYNYRDLRRGLVARGHRFRSAGDTETIVHLYEECGSECVKQLRGMFAFALWDDREATLLLARDRFGIKPLYFVDGPWGIAFASELKALHAVGLTSGTIDLAALDLYLRLGYVPAPATPFEDARKIEPGHLLIWRQHGSTEIRRYWDLPRHEAAAGRATAHQVLEWLDDSVAAHMVSDVPVAAFLSGGLDSSAVVSSMALQTEAPHAYTVRYSGSGAKRADETALAEALARRYGVRHTVIEVTPDVRDLLEPIAFALDEPHADESAVPTWLIAQAVAADYKVVLTGTGGDELFAGYRRHIALRWSQLHGRLPGGLRRLLSRLAARVPESRDGGLGVHRMKRFLLAEAEDPAGRYFELQTRLRRHEREELYAADVAAETREDAGRVLFAQLHASGGARTGVRAALYLDYKTYLPDDLLHLTDRLGMAHSLEIRVPFVDHEFVDRAFQIPDRVRIGHGRNKRLLRRSLRKRLPARHLTAPKRGFVGPTANWLRNELRELLEDELSPERMRRLGFFTPRTVERLLSEHFSRTHNREGILWALLCFSSWHRLFVEASPAHAGRRDEVAVAP